MKYFSCFWYCCRVHA